MSARVSQHCAGRRAFVVLFWLSLAVSQCGHAQQLSPAATEQPQSPVSALAERLALQLTAAGKKRPFILDLALPNDSASPLGVWLADQLSDRLAQSHPELQVIPRHPSKSFNDSSEFAHDRNQQVAQLEQHAQQLGAEILVQGNFAAVPGGIGITLLVSDPLVRGSSRFEVLAELPFTPEMDNLLAGPLPERVSIQGAYRASVAGIGSPLCEDCPPPSYTYVARAKKLAGVVIAEVLVSANGSAERIKIIRAPNDDLANAALHAVRNWRFKPARNFQGECVPVIVDVAVSFRLDALQSAPTTAMNKRY